MRISIAKIAVLGLLISASLTFADPNSGPDAGTKLTKLKVAVVTGDDAGKEVDFIGTRKDAPTVYLLVAADKFDRPLARFMKVLDTDLKKDRADIQIVAIWLADDVAKYKEYLPKAQQSMKFEQTTLGVHPGDVNGPEGFNIHTGAHLTVVIADKQTVVASLGFRSVNDTDVPGIVEKLPKKR